MPESLHISGIPCSLVLGAVANNLAPPNVRQMLQPGVKFATTTVLRAGIVAVGAKLSATQVLALGWTTVPAACASVGAGLVAIPLLAKGAGCRRGSGRCWRRYLDLRRYGHRGDGAGHRRDASRGRGGCRERGSVWQRRDAGLSPRRAALFPHEDSKNIGLFLGLAVHDTAQAMGARRRTHRRIVTRPWSRPPPWPS